MKRTSWVLLFAGLVGCVALLAACATPEPTVPPEPTAVPFEQPTEVPPTEAPLLEDLLVTLQNDGRFSKLLELVAVAGVTDTLTGMGPLTLLAPTDDAFAALPEGTLDGLTPEEVADILLAHLISGTVLSADIAAAPEMTLEGVTLKEGTSYSITSDGLEVSIGDMAKVIEADKQCTNGVIHVIDAVLLPAAEAEATE